MNMEATVQPTNTKRKSAILKIALFATGLSGIVAEYILSTLATYFLGDSILQWTLVVSFMLFAMGLGSHLSQYFKGKLLETFIIIEFTLSILVSFSAIFVYTVHAYSSYNGIFIYGLAILVGMMIGLEIPIVTRLNQEYQSLRVNIASVMEQDYFGSLLGGLFFAFVALPYLGMTYTPFILGTVNFTVAVLLYFRLRKLIEPRWQFRLNLMMGFVFLAITLGSIYAKPIIIFGEQKKYKDKVIYEFQSRYQKLVITQWKNHHWLFINGNQQLSTLDEEMYHEPLVHPVMTLSPNPQHVLVLGGGDGAAVREILKYPQVQDITLVDLDPAMTKLAKTHPVLLQLNDSSFYDPKLTIKNMDAFIYMDQTKKFYDVIIIDLPDPRTVELGKLFSKEFYQLCRRHLRPHGLIIAQSGSPYYSTRAYECINKTMQAAGFGTTKIHNQVLTLGEWGWVIGAKDMKGERLKKTLRKLEFKHLKTKWINNESMLLMTSFGKDAYFKNKIPDSTVQVNTIHNPVLYRYYLQGNWELY